MRPEIELIILVLLAVLFGLVAGAHSAMQLLSYARTAKNGDDDTSGNGFVARLLDDAVYTYLGLGIGRILTLALVLFASYRVASQRFLGSNAGEALVVMFMAGAILLPPAVANLAALRSPERFLHLSRFALYPITYLLRPIAIALVKVARRFSPRLVDALVFPALTFQEKIELLGNREGQDDTDEQNLVSSVFEFGDTRVREVMVPRIDMVAVNVNMNPSEAVDVIVGAGHSRVPVFDESIDKIVGVVHTKDILERMVTQKEFTLSSLRRPAYFVPESKMIDELLSEFKKLRAHLAIVVDEYGGTAGLITLEDVLEELVGDIQDEFDSEEELIDRLDDDTALCSARIRLDDLNEALGLDLPSSEVDSLGGFLYETIGRVPRIGETLQRGPISFEIQSVLRQRIDKVRIRGLSSVRRDVEDVG